MEYHLRALEFLAAQHPKDAELLKHLELERLTFQFDQTKILDSKVNFHWLTSTKHFKGNKRGPANNSKRRTIRTHRNPKARK